ncbi:MAG TPA: ribosome biogenesis GTPase Der [Candidatus Marinimicrobia bacterium]|nr:ribosome biogenesis GTPase Der [Candidatus Neomarinimicrobiota bacterium]
MSIPVVAIVGRPNVGKSTFFNRVLRQRKAIVDPQEGITRDRVYGETEWAGKRISLIDTGGFIPEDVDIFNAAIREQAKLAMGEADVVLLMVDGREDITSSDQVLAQAVRESGKPHILVVNKCDNMKQDDRAHGYHELGIEPVLPMSALSGRLTGDVLEAVAEKMKLSERSDIEEKSADLHLAIIGMPNVGKSSLLNALLQKEQTIVTPIAGTTRDSIDTKLKWYGKDIILVDTAGLRKKSKITDAVEFYSTVRTKRSVDKCDVALVLIDAAKGFNKQDRSIIDQVLKTGKGLVIVVNKWDLIEKDTHTMNETRVTIREQFPKLDDFPILFVSALTRQRVSGLLKKAFSIYENYNRVISTKKLNTFLENAIKMRSVPAEKGKLIRMKFIKQVSSAPPLFACYANYPKLIPTHYKRFMENQLREVFNFEGVPIRFSFRKS